MATATFFSSTTTSALGPLMTTFTPPSSCANVVLSGCNSYTDIGYSGESAYTACPWIERDVTCGSDGEVTRASECFPDLPASSSIYLYSPATACPAGHTTGGRIVDNTEQTTVICCPSDFTTHSLIGSNCLRSITESTIDVFFCSSGQGLVRTTAADTADGAFYTTHRFVWAAQVRLALPASLSDPSSFTALDQPTSSPSPPNEENSDEDSTPEMPSEGKKKSGLGGGVIAGIVVGAVAALVLAGTAVFFWCRRKHRHMPVSKGSPGGERNILPEYVGGNGAANGLAQMATTTSNGLFQPQPAPGFTR